MELNKLVNPTIMWSVVAIGVIISFVAFSDKPILERTIWSWFTFITTIMIWFYLSTNAIKSHKKAAASVDAINYLSKGGVYNVIRHPMYVGDVILAWGLFFFYPTEQVLVSVTWITIVLYLWMKIEERALLNKFGIEYEDYIQEVPMLIPDIKKKIKKNENNTN